MKLQFLHQVSDIDDVSIAKRTDLLKKHFSVFGPGIIVRTDLNDEGTDYSIEFPDRYSVQKNCLTSNFDLGTFEGSLVSIKNTNVGHPFQSDVVLVEKKGSVLHHLSHTRAEFEDLDSSTVGVPGVYRTTMTSHICNSLGRVSDRNAYNHRATGPREIQRDKITFYEGDTMCTEVFESFAGEMKAEVDEVESELDCDRDVGSEPSGTSEGTSRTNRPRRRDKVVSALKGLRTQLARSSLA